MITINGKKWTVVDFSDNALFVTQHFGKLYIFNQNFQRLELSELNIMYNQDILSAFIDTKNKSLYVNYISNENVIKSCRLYFGNHMNSYRYNPNYDYNMNSYIYDPNYDYNHSLRREFARIPNNLLYILDREYDELRNVIVAKYLIMGEYFYICNDLRNVIFSAMVDVLRFVQYRSIVL